MHVVLISRIITLVLISKRGVYFGKSLVDSVKTYCCKCEPNPPTPPTVRKGDRGCLPWEIPDQRQKLLDRQKAGIVCDDCKSQEIINSFKSILEQRRLEKCDPREMHNCQSHFDEITITRKTYPYLEMGTKKCLPGCPVPGWQLLNTDC